MKKVLFSILLLLSLLIHISCSEKEFVVDEKIADATFNEIIDAIKHRDDLKITAMFSKAIQDENSLSQDTLRLIDFIHGDINMVSSASEVGVGIDYETNNGKKRAEIQSSFCVVTTETKYYIAIKECVRDDFNSDNEGIVSIYIIESSNWTEDYVYRGDGKWSRGINIFG